MTRKELLRMMPADKDDLPSAQCIVKLGYPAVQPVLKDMIKWMRVAESTVADSFAQFFAKLGHAGVDAIAEGLHSDNCWVRHRIFVQVIPSWPPASIARLKDVLAMIATHPDAYNNDLLSISLLRKWQLADPEWLSGWVTFKKDRLEERCALLKHVQEELAAG